MKLPHFSRLTKSLSAAEFRPSTAGHETTPLLSINQIGSGRRPLFPGFGPRTTPRALTEIGDPHRFANGAKLASYASLAPTDRRSGRTPGTTTHNRGGNHPPNAKRQAAFVAIQHDPHAKRYYQTKRQQGKTHRTALTAVARRRYNIILTILKTQTPYNPKPI